jgi:hypothetical protein
LKEYKEGTKEYYDRRKKQEEDTKKYGNKEAQRTLC